MPDPSSPVLEFLSQLHSEIAGIVDGEVATYIPQLGEADPNWFGICLVTAGGHVYEVGETGIPFTIQSISKPFAYGIALEDNGLAEVLSKVGVEPTGDVFNSISLEPGTGRPRNPMINAGAIATVGLIPGTNASSRERRILDAFSLFAGRDLEIDEGVYNSESESGHRNRAIGHMLRNFDILTSKPDPTVELYFRQCAISVTCRDLGVMAATLANRGVNPVTNKQALRGEYVESMLSVMSSCGMYDWAGEWIYNVGMPAKSGVAGGIIAVLPGQLGIGVFSPPLDSHGNSVRGIKVCEAISRQCNLHLFNRTGSRDGAIRLQFSGRQLNSRRVRSASETAVLQEKGGSIRVYQLQGNMTFATTEAVAHSVMDRIDELEHVVLDFGHVLTINDTSARMIYELSLRLASLGKRLISTHPDRVPLLRRVFKIRAKERFAELFLTFPDNDPALEWCEERLLKSHGIEPELDHMPTIAECDLFEGLSEQELEVLSSCLEMKKFPAGGTVIETGAEASELYLLAMGRVSVFVEHESGARRRLATFSPGMVFGEVALIDSAPRSATIIADSAVECIVLTVDDFHRLGADHPAIKIKLLENLSRGLCRKLRKANRELSVFD
jgi:glutaminase